MEKDVLYAGREGTYRILPVENGKSIVELEDGTRVTMALVSEPSKPIRHVSSVVAARRTRPGR